VQSQGVTPRHGASGLRSAVRTPMCVMGWALAYCRGPLCHDTKSSPCPGHTDATLTPSPGSGAIQVPAVEPDEKAEK